MNKKLGVFLIILLAFLPLVLAENENLPGLPGNTPFNINPNDLPNPGDSPTTWLGSLFNIFLEKPLQLISSILDELSPVFNFIFDIPYSPSLTFLLTLLFWVYFAALTYMIVKIGFNKQRLVAVLSGVVIAIILAKIKIILGIRILIEKLLSITSNTTIKVFIIIFLIFGLVILFMWIKSKFIGKKSREKKREAEETKKAIKKIKDEDNDEDLETGKSFIKTLGEELNKPKGEGEFETEDFDVPNLRKAV